MKKIIILIVVLLASFGLKGQDTIWKDGALWRVDYEKLLAVPDSTKAKNAKEVLNASRIPIYDTSYQVDVNSLRNFFLFKKKRIVTERGIRGTDKKEYYEKTTRFVEWEEFNWWVLVILPSLIFLSLLSLWLDKKIKGDPAWPLNIFTIGFFPFMFFALFFLGLFTVVFPLLYDAFPGGEFLRFARLLFLVFFILIMPLMRFFQKRRAKKG